MTSPAIFICGCDEVGRGPLAGPVTAACVHIPLAICNLPFWETVTDSKKLSKKKREALAPLIMQHSQYGIASCSVTEIDTLNILQASLLAMQRAFMNMIEVKKTPTLDFNNILCLIDGRHIPKNLPCPAQAIIQGDRKVKEIGAASIIAKVARDHMMSELHMSYPMYGWDQNAGYGSQQHLDALRQFGPTPHHRQTFAPMKKILAA